MPVRDYLGRHPQGDGDWFYGVHVQNGRIEDRPGVQLKTALHDITYRYQPDITLTPQQNLLLTGLPEVVIPEIERILSEYGVAPAETLAPARRFSIACPALPTCGLALSEAERGMPAVLDQIEMELKKLGLQDEPISIRMTGCPNGCARPYTADIAFVGKGPDNYNVYVGGRLSGDRVVDLYAADVASSEFLPVLRPLLGDWAKHRGPGEGFGDFYQRVVQRRAPRKRITGDEKPTEQTIALRVLRC